MYDWDFGGGYDFLGSAEASVEDLMRYADDSMWGGFTPRVTLGENESETVTHSLPSVGLCVTGVPLSLLNLETKAKMEAKHKAYLGSGHLTIREVIDCQCHPSQDFPYPRPAAHHVVDTGLTGARHPHSHRLGTSRRACPGAPIPGSVRGPCAHPDGKAAGNDTNATTDWGAMGV